MTSARGTPVYPLRHVVLGMSSAFVLAPFVVMVVFATRSSTGQESFALWDNFARALTI